MQNTALVKKGGVAAEQNLEGERSAAPWAGAGCSHTLNRAGAVCDTTRPWLGRLLVIRGEEADIIHRGGPGIVIDVRDADHEVIRIGRASGPHFLSEGTIGAFEIQGAIKTPVEVGDQHNQGLSPAGFAPISPGSCSSPAR